MLLKIGVFAEDVEPLLFEPAAEDAIEHCGVDDPGLHRLHLDGLIADDLKLDLIALHIQSEMLEPKQGAHPYRAADAGDAEALTAQIFGAFDVGTRDEVVGIAAGRWSARIFKSWPAAIAAKSCAAAGAGRREYRPRPSRLPKWARRG